uniref:Nucleolar protein 8 isoform X2 n=1 Tax=Petromyzon marinus TaxID=7757 RepID=A0AAJ7X970_PETMA|nr:nucleolar protein 8 isoform X2 [Petromyzon marinus]
MDYDNSCRRLKADSAVTRDPPPCVHLSRRAARAEPRHVTSSSGLGPTWWEPSAGVQGSRGEMGTRAVAEGAQGATRGIEGAQGAARGIEGAQGAARDASRRVFVGGLVASVRPEELRRRFEAFGAVGDVAVKTRSDETGTPIKTFAYVSLQTSDAELRKCFSVLNHTKWKGGTLQLELAKESFLQRLEKERAERAVAKEEEVGAAGGGGPGNPPLLVALNAAGAANFHMRGVVPGTEVPGVPDWVVSKFGRVLPIVKVRRKDKKKDPSKFCHNLKRLAAPEVETPPTPVSQLTWQLPDDDKKKKKTKRPERPPAARRGAATPKPASRNNRGGVGARGNGAESDEADSEEELARMVEAAAQVEERPRQRRLRDDGDQELEVVPVGFVPSRPRAGDASDGNDSDGEEGGSVWLPRATDRAVVAVATGEARTAALPRPTPKRGAAPGTAAAEGKKRKRVGKSCPHCSKELAEEDEEDEEDDEEDEDDEEYAKMMQGCYRLELSLDDLRAAVSGSQGGSPDDDPSDRNKLNGPEREPRVAEPEPKRGAPTPGGSSTTRSSSKKKLKRDSVDRDVDEVCDEEGGLSAGRHSSRPPLFLGTRWLFGDTRDGGGGRGGGPGETAGLPARPAPGDESGRGAGDEEEVEEEKQEEEEVLCRKSKSKKRKKVEKEVVEEEEEEVKENAVYCKINSKTKRKKKKKEEEVEEEVEESVCHKNKKKKKRKEEKDEGVEEERGHTEVAGSQPQEEEGKEEATMSRPGRVVKTGFGEDERFRLDGRFEDNDEEGEGSQGGGDGVETPGGSELKQPKSGELVKGVVTPASFQQDPKGAKRTTLSKAERRQRREEERWGPPVSANTYYHVTSELKQLFGGGQEEKGAAVVDEVPPPTQFAFDFLSGGSGSTEARDQGGFSFCFSVPEGAQELAPAGDRKSVPFQPDGSFHDSSSEEEEQDEVEEENEVEGAGTLGSPSTASGLKFFFFTKDDARLTEGPQSFCRSKAMEEVRDGWEEMRANLRQDYRKKHKDAIRKSRTKPGTAK